MEAPATPSCVSTLSSHVSPVLGQCSLPTDCSPPAKSSDPEQSYASSATFTHPGSSAPGPRADPSAPLTPAGSSAPGHWLEPSDPLRPTRSSAPGHQVEPSAPLTPPGSSAPGHQVEPSAPLTPPGSSAAGHRVEPSAPLRPAGSSASEDPFAPAESSRPAYSLAPADTCPTRDCSFREKAIRYIMKGNYSTAFRLLCQQSPCAKQALKETYLSYLKSEWTTGHKQLSTFKGPAETTTDVVECNWTTAMQQVSAYLPLMHAVITTLMPRKEHMKRHIRKGPRDNRRFLTDKEVSDKFDARLGVITAIILYSTNPWVFNRIPSLMGLHLWLEGASQSVYLALNRIGVSQSCDATRNHIDHMRLDYDKDILSWKQHAEVTEIATSSQPTHNTMAPAPTPGYAIGFDNVQFSVSPNYRSKDNKSAFHIMALCYAARNRVHYPLAFSSTTTAAQQLAPLTFIPTEENFDDLKMYLKEVMKDIIKKHMLNIPASSSAAPDHQYKKVLNTKSDICNLGVIEGNPSTTPDTIHILSRLLKYVPVREGQPLNLPLHGDGGTIESVAKAKKGRSLSKSPMKGLSSFVELAQEFHKEGILLQDLMDHLDTKKSMSNPGTLYQMKMVFGHYSAQPPVMSNFKDVWNMVSFITEGMAVLLFMKMAGMTNMDGVPDIENGSGDIWLNATVDSMLDRLFVRPPPEDLRAVADGYTENAATVDNEVELYPFCFCKQDTLDDMVECCNSKCPVGWVHYGCVRPSPITSAPRDDWFCSDECETASSYIFCVCNAKKGGRMVQCFLKDQCHRHEWYHVTCLGKKEGHRFPAKWLCSEQCALQEETCDDGILQYSLSLLWQGLNLLARRRIVREGNGPLMLAMWRIDMVQFWEKKHPRYLRIGHRLLAYTGGFLPPQDAFEITWNRVANMKGKKNGNIPLDLLNEFLNKDFKEMMKHSRGQYTTEQIQRCSQMGGAFRAQLRDLMFEAGLTGDTALGSSASKQPANNKQVELFVQEYSDDALFDYCPPRSHRAFPQFMRDNGHIKRPHKLGHKLKEHSHQMDMWRGISDAAMRN